MVVAAAVAAEVAARTEGVGVMGLTEPLYRAALFADDREHAYVQVARAETLRGLLMNRVAIACSAVIAVALAIPEPALAAERVRILGASPLSLVISLSGLGVALVLLVEVINLRRVALGGAITERISYVVLAIVCLGASALAQWTRNFAHGVTLQQLSIVAEVLVIVAMGLFSAYFASVRRALEGYLTTMTGGETLASEGGNEADEGPEAPRG